MLNRTFYDEYPTICQYLRYQIIIQPIQLANGQCMTVKEALKVMMISFESNILKIIVYLLPFSNSFDFFFGLKNMIEIGRKSSYSKLEFKFDQKNQ